MNIPFLANMDPESKKKLTTALGILVALAFLGAGYFFLLNKGVFTPMGQPISISEKEALENFPPDLLQESKLLAASSEKIIYSTSSDQFSISFMSGKTMEQNIYAYREYLRKNNWSLLQDASMPKTQIPFFYAVKGEGENLNITFVPVDNQVKIIIAYYRDQK